MTAIATKLEKYKNPWQVRGVGGLGRPGRSRRGARPVASVPLTGSGPTLQLLAPRQPPLPTITLSPACRS